MYGRYCPRSLIKTPLNFELEECTLFATLVRKAANVPQAWPIKVQAHKLNITMTSQMLTSTEH